MKFKIDENLPQEFASALRSAGHDALTVLDQGLVGAADQEIARRCRDEERVLMSLDLDFSDMRIYPPGQYAGIIVFRVRHQDKNFLMNILGKIIPIIEREPLLNSLWIVEENKIRIRGEAKM
jgi:predicted nuclease of predicted toxin-antitoxin system